MRSRENARGYYDRELTKNTRDLKEVFDFGVVSFPDLPHDHPQNRDLINGYNLWPEDLPDFKSTMMCYLAACEKLGWQLLELFRELAASSRPCAVAVTETIAAR